jgi:hypothetical protein
MRVATTMMLEFDALVELGELSKSTGKSKSSILNGLLVDHLAKLAELPTAPTDRLKFRREVENA